MKFKKTAEEVLFDSKLPSDLPYSKSSFTMDSSAGNGTKMMTAMGQGETQVSPYHMALITSAIANGGKLMKPYLVDKVTNASGAVMKETDQKEYKQLMTAEEAAPDQRIHEERSRLRYRICIERTELHSSGKDRYGRI